jgi:hypothetical protein
MNLDASQSSDNGTTSSSSTSSSRGLLPNGGCASLRLPVVVVLNPFYPTSVVLYSIVHR